MSKWGVWTHYQPSLDKSDKTTKPFQFIPISTFKAKWNFNFTWILHIARSFENGRFLTTFSSHRWKYYGLWNYKLIFRTTKQLSKYLSMLEENKLKDWNKEKSLTMKKPRPKWAQKRKSPTLPITILLNINQVFSSISNDWRKKNYWQEVEKCHLQLYWTMNLVFFYYCFDLYKFHIFCLMFVF